jgi:NitT/TauT family transport system permease protein
MSEPMLGTGAIAVESDGGTFKLLSWRSARESLGYLGLQILVVALFLTTWQLAADHGVVDEFFVSSPSAVGEKLYDWFADGSIWHHMVVTLREALYGWTLGSAVGIVIGFVLGRVEPLNRVFAPLLHLANTLPRVALAPLFIVWFGIGELSKVLLVVTIVIFIMVFSTHTGVTTVNRDYILTARLLGAGEWQLTRKVILPWCVPFIFVGLRWGLAWSLSGAVIGEFLAARAGLGYLIYYHAGVLDNAGVLAGCVLLLAMALVFLILISLAERRLLRWRPQ